MITKVIVAHNLYCTSPSQWKVSCSWFSSATFVNEKQWQGSRESASFTITLIKLSGNVAQISAANSSQTPFKKDTAFHCVTLDITQAGCAQCITNDETTTWVRDAASLKHPLHERSTVESVLISFPLKGGVVIEKFWWDPIQPEDILRLPCAGLNSNKWNKNTDNSG